MVKESGFNLPSIFKKKQKFMFESDSENEDSDDENNKENCKQNKVATQRFEKLNDK